MTAVTAASAATASAAPSLSKALRCSCNRLRSIRIKRSAAREATAPYGGDGGNEQYGHGGDGLRGTDGNFGTPGVNGPFSNGMYFGSGTDGGDGTDASTPGGPAGAGGAAGGGGGGGKGGRGGDATAGAMYVPDGNVTLSQNVFDANSAFAGQGGDGGEGGKGGLGGTGGTGGGGGIGGSGGNGGHAGFAPNSPGSGGNGGDGSDGGDGAKGGDGGEGGTGGDAGDGGNAYGGGLVVVGGIVASHGDTFTHNRVFGDWTGNGGKGGEGGDGNLGGYGAGGGTGGSGGWLGQGGGADSFDPNANYKGPHKNGDGGNNGNTGDSGDGGDAGAGGDGGSVGQAGIGLGGNLYVVVGVMTVDSGTIYQGTGEAFGGVAQFVGEGGDPGNGGPGAANYPNLQIALARAVQHQPRNCGNQRSGRSSRHPGSTGARGQFRRSRSRRPKRLFIGPDLFGSVTIPGGISAFVDAGGGLTISDAGGIGHSFKATRSGNILSIFDVTATFGPAPAGGTVSPDGRTLSFDVSVTNITSITINGAGSDDNLTVDFTTGNPIPAGGLSFNGGGPGDGSG